MNIKKDLFPKKTSNSTPVGTQTHNRIRSPPHWSIASHGLHFQGKQHLLPSYILFISKHHVAFRSILNS